MGKPDPVLPPCDLKKVVAMIESLVCVSRPRCRGLCVCWNGYRPVVPDWSLKIQPNPNHGCVAYSVCFGKSQTVSIVKRICSQSWCKRPVNQRYPDCCHLCNKKTGVHAPYCKSC